MRKINKTTFAKSILLHENLEDKTLVWDGQPSNSSYTVYSSSGDICIKGTVKYGELEGQKIHYFPNGKISQSSFYVNGSVHDKFKVYYENGSVHSEGVYKYGTLHGPFMIYHLNGQKSCEVNYNNGTKVGIERRYYNNGNIKLECNYDDIGALDGSCKNYTKQGKLKSECLYKNGTVVT